MSEVLQKIGSVVGTWQLLSRVRRLRRGLLPSSFRDQPTARAALTRWLLLGLLLRLLFMPFAAHADYQSEHWRAELAAFGDLSYPTRIEPLSHYLDALTMRVIAPLLPEHDYLFWPPPERLEGGLSYPHVVDYNRFADYPRVNRAIFLTRLPYLLFDLFSALLLLHLFDDASKSVRAFKYWMLNPAIIYAVYIYGRYETYGLALTLLSMLLLRRGRKSWGALALGVSLLCRVAVLFVVPVYAMAASKRWSRRFVTGMLALLPTVTFILVMERVLGFRPAAFAGRSPVYFSMVLKPFGQLVFYPFIIGYVLVMLALDSRPREADAFRGYGVASLLVYLLMFMLAWYSPPYYTWIMPFLVWTIGDKPSFGKFFVWQTLAWAFYWFVWRDIGAFTPYLFAPITTYTRTIQPNQVLLGRLEVIGLTRDQVISIARSAVAAISAWMIVAGLRLEAKRLKTRNRAGDC